MRSYPTTALLRARVLPLCAAQQRPSSTLASSPRSIGSVEGRRTSTPSVPSASVGLRPPETLERPQQHENLQPSCQEDQTDADRGMADPPTEVAAAAAAGGGGAAGLLPKLALLGAAALWGSYAPAVRLLYESPNPPDAVVVMAARGLLQSLVLLLASLALQRATDSSSSSSSSSGGGGGEASTASSSSVAAAGSSSSSSSSSGSSGSSGNAFEDWLFLRSPKLWQAALELGFFNYSATWLQVGCSCCWFRLVAADAAAAAATCHATRACVRCMQVARQLRGVLVVG